MARRKILKAQDRRELFDIPDDEDSLIRHYSLSAADRLEIDLRRREHNKLGFAVQLCVMRHPGRVLAAGEIPPGAMQNMSPTRSAPIPLCSQPMPAGKKRVAITLRA